MNEEYDREHELVKADFEFERWSLNYISNVCCADGSEFESDSAVIREMIYDSIALRDMWDDYPEVRKAYNDYISKL